MSILHDEGQQAIATESRRVLEARIGKDDLLPLLQASGRYHEGFWTTAKEQGWTALALPEAAIEPEPVRAVASTSRPPSTAGMASCWMAVGVR